MASARSRHAARSKQSPFANLESLPDDIFSIVIPFCNPAARLCLLFVSHRISTLARLFDPDPSATNGLFRGANFSRHCAYTDDLNMLKWSRSGRCPCPWDHMTFSTAVQFSSPTMLDYLFDNFCPFLESKFSDRVASPAVLEWLQARMPEAKISSPSSSLLLAVLPLPSWSLDDLRSLIANFRSKTGSFTTADHFVAASRSAVPHYLIFESLRVRGRDDLC